MNKKTFDRLSAGIRDAVEIIHKSHGASMRPETAIGAAFKNHGLESRDAEFDIAIAKYLNSGGTIAGAVKRLDVAAERMSGMGLATSADKSGQMPNAQTRQQVEGGGASVAMPRGRHPIASPPSINRGGDGLSQNAYKGHLEIAVPVREPKPQRAAIDFGAASLAIKTKLAQSALDRWRTHDDRPWGDVKAYELDNMGRDGALARALKNHLGELSNSRYSMTVRELVNPETFEAIRSKAHGA
jgi:hypothetical protein